MPLEWLENVCLLKKVRMKTEKLGWLFESLVNEFERQDEVVWLVMNEKSLSVRLSAVESFEIGN